MKHSSYRADIDGLRAVAVLSVLVFHAFPGFLPGGFVGVDIFFIISGFLISGIILTGLETGKFTFAGFYARRIRRIFPALTIVLTVTLLVGWFVLFPINFRELGLHAAAGAAFVSNLALWSEAGYFDTAAMLKPLLHLWSLGIEEQYYLIWPLLLMLFYRLGRRRLALVILLGALVSFAINVAIVRSHPWAAFYSPMTRFWELMIGSIAACLYQERSESASNTALAVVGALLLAAALVMTREHYPFPGWWALLPTVGAACIIFAGPHTAVNRAIANPAFVYIGLISYPLYLWHWPLLTFARIAHDGELPPAWLRFVILVVSVILADLTYRLVERKIRFRKGWVVPGLATAMSLIAVCGVLAITQRVVPVSASVPYLPQVSEALSDWKYKRGTVRGDTDRVVLFFGDSHMQQYWPRVEKIMREHKAPVHTVEFHATGGCAPIPGIDRPGYGCVKFVDDGFKRALAPEVDTVVIAASWFGFVARTDYYVAGLSGSPLDLNAPSSAWVLEGFEKALLHLRQQGKRVILVLSSPRGDQMDPDQMLNHAGLLKWSVTLSGPLPRSELAQTLRSVDPKIAEIAHRVDAELIDPADWLCSKDECPAVDQEGRPLYKDASHLRATTVREQFAAFDSLIYLPGAVQEAQSFPGR